MCDRVNLLARLETAAMLKHGLFLSAADVQLLLSPNSEPAVPDKIEPVNLRWAMQSDLGRDDRIGPLIQVDLDCERCWTKEQFHDYLAQRNQIILLAEYDHDVVGYICYSLKKRLVLIDRIGVKRSLRRRGIGTRLLEEITKKARMKKYSRIEVRIGECDLELLAFFNANGFGEAKLLRNMLSDQDGISMAKPVRCKTEAQ